MPIIRPRPVVFAVDEGILQVARYKLGDPLAFFFRKKMLEVQTSQILDLILPDFEKLMASAAAPGGDADAALSRQLNSVQAQARQTGWCIGRVSSMSMEGRISTYTVPDYFNGKLRVMAVARIAGSCRYL